MKQVDFDAIVMLFQEKEIIPKSKIVELTARNKKAFIRAMYERGFLVKYSKDKKSEIKYSLIPAKENIIDELLEKKGFKRAEILYKYRIGIPELRDLLKSFGYKVVKSGVNFWRVKEREINNSIPCLRNLDSCAHGDRCYLSYKCKAWQKHLESYNHAKTA